MKEKLVCQNLSKIDNIDTGAILHALVDIKESMDAIYSNILPKLSVEGISQDEVQDLLWDIREEFRHVEYHIHDSKILD